MKPLYFMKPTLLVLAAGMGSRYGGLKQIDPMGPNGETVLDYSVHDAIRAEFGRVVFIIREDFFEKFREHIGTTYADSIQVDYAFQSLNDLPQGFILPVGRIKPWGTAHAIRAARHLIRESFAVVNADDFYGRDAYHRAAKFLTAPHLGNEISHYAMIGYPLANTLSAHGAVNRGICGCDQSDHLTHVEEYVKIQRETDGIIRGNSLDGTRRAIADECLVSMNFWIFPANFFADLEAEFIEFLNGSEENLTSECYIPTVVDSLIRAEKADCKVLATTSNWFGITYPEDKPNVVASIQSLIGSGDYSAEMNTL